MLNQTIVHVAKPENFMLQIQWVVQRKNSASGFVAIDSVEFKFFEECKFTPEQAKPIPTTIPPTTTKAPTTAPPTTTIEPTEPPDCKLWTYENSLLIKIYSQYI